MAQVQKSHMNKLNFYQVNLF